MNVAINVSGHGRAPRVVLPRHELHERVVTDMSATATPIVYTKRKRGSGPRQRSRTGCNLWPS